MTGRSWRRPFFAALLAILFLVMARFAIAETTQERLQNQIADNQKWELDARQVQSRYFQKGEELLGAQEFTEAVQFYLKVLQVSYPQWDIKPYSPAIRYPGTPSLMQLPGMKVVMKQLVTDLNDKANDKLNNMKKVQLATLIDGSWKSVDELLAAGKAGQAYAILKRISSADMPDSLHRKYDAQLTQRMTDIEKQASDALAELKKNLAAQDVEKSKTALNAFRDKFGEFEECPPIHSLYEETVNMPEFQTMLREDAAAERFAEAQEMLKGEKFADAEDYLQEISDRYADTAAGKQAKTKLDEMHADKALMRTIANDRASQQCEEMLRKARNFRANGLTADAEKLCRKIIERFPDTDFADKAGKMLAEMGGAR
jgi:Asp-tRNA(Asn)/Glu-tRNA(Gln) amidotransferase C subunit